MSHWGTALPRLRIAHIGLLCAVVAVASCRHVPSAPIDPGVNARRLAARSLDNSAVKAALTSYGLTVPASPSWSLDQLTVAAWTLRPDVALARSEVEAAKANIVVQGKRPNPTLSLSPERVIANAAGANPWVIATSLALPIETAGKRGIRRARAAAMERAVADAGAPVAILCDVWLNQDGGAPPQRVSPTLR